MQYRDLGKTGKKASIIGFGAEYLDRKPYERVEEVINRVLEQGINMMDLFMPGSEVRRNIGQALGSRRKQIQIQGAIGSVDLKEQYDISRDLDTCKRFFESLLTDLKTDYIDFGMFFFMDTEEALRQIIDNGIVAYAQELKKQGVIHHIGATSHNAHVARQMVEMGLLETLMFSVNPAFDMNAGDVSIDGLMDSLEDRRLEGVSPERAALYLACEQRGVGITTMKTLGAGKLLSKTTSPFKDALTVGQCIHYALTRPAIASVMLGYSTAAEVDEACRYLTLTDEEKDYGNVAHAAPGLMHGACVYCNHCQPCPVSIDIASVNRYRDIARLDLANIPPSIVQHYNSLDAKGGECIACGSCEERCPFGVEIINNMADAAEIFGA